MFLQIIGAPTSLDIASVQNIANSINDISVMTPPADSETAEVWGRIEIGIDPTLEGNSDIEAALTTIRNKGWNVTPMYGIGSAYVPTPDEGLLKYNHCTTYTECRTVDANVATDVDESGAWNYRLNNLRTGGGIDYESYTSNGLFWIDEGNTSLVSFNVDLPNLIDGSYMFRDCTALTSFSSDLPNLTNGSYMFRDCTALTSFSSDLLKLSNGSYMFYNTALTEWTINLPNLTNGSYMFQACKGLTEWTINLPNLTDGTYMFKACKGLTEWTVDLPNLTDGNGMFNYCTNLTSFSVDLPNLTDGTKMFENTALTEWTVDLPNLTDGLYMFQDCTGLTEWTVDLPNLTEGCGMFQGCTGLTEWTVDLPNLEIVGNSYSHEISGMFQDCTGLTSFSGDLPSLTYGWAMFRGCTNLTSFSVDLPSLTDGNSMFRGCTNLTSFSGDLPKLTNGEYMFGYSNFTCTKLNLASVQHIANTINDLTAAGTRGNIYIGMQTAIRDTADLETALAAIRAKGWTVSEMYRN